MASRASLPDALADDRGDDLRIGEELRRRPVGEHLARLQRHDAARVLGHQVHVVLDQDDRLHAGALRAASTSVVMMPCLSPLETPLVGSSSRITSGDEREGAGDVEQLLLALREQARLGVELGLEAEDARRPRAPARAPRRPSRPRRRAAGSCRSARRRPPRSSRATVIAGKMCTSWKARAMPRLREPHRADAGDVLALEAHDARCVGLSRPVSTLTSVVLPAPFGPDDRDQLALGDRRASRPRSATKLAVGLADADGLDAAARHRRRAFAPAASCAEAHQAAREERPRSAPGSRRAGSASTA